MREEFNLLDFMLGLPLGISVAFIAWYFVWRKGKRERRYDERYKRIREQAGLLAWSITIIAIVAAWSIIIIFEGPGLAFFIFTALYIISILAYSISFAIADKKN